VLVVSGPSDPAYEQAIVAADCVLCLRAGSVGETNAPLLEALGAGRAVLATASGSIPEVARDAGLYCEATIDGIRAGLAALDDAATRAEHERAAAARAAQLTWRASATAHASLFHEVFA
jgi:glycosyltransferase involved in cell wall biosynthesis